jgi:hypothetical protein
MEPDIAQPIFAGNDQLLARLLGWNLDLTAGRYSSL